MEIIIFLIKKQLFNVRQCQRKNYKNYQLQDINFKKYYHNLIAH